MKTTRIMNSLPGVITLCLLALTSHGQLFKIDWFTIDGGGGISSGGAYSVSGTIGQPGAAVLTGGQYSLAGGFWGGIGLVQTPGAPTLSIEKLADGVRVFWPAPATGLLLDQSLAVTGTWSQASFPYATNSRDISVSVPAPAGNRFYRL